MHRILAINPGSTSTKVALYEDERAIWSESISYSREQLSKFKRIIDQADMRRKDIESLLQSKSVDLTEVSAVVGRGGPFKPLTSGTYKVDENVLDDVSHGRVQAEHISNIGPVLAYELAKMGGKPSFFVDPVSVDEFESVARISGLPELERKSLVHALNVKAVAIRASKDLNRPLSELNFIVAHLGGGITICPLEKGRIVDVNNANEAGPFSPERAGTLPSYSLVQLCFLETIQEREEILKRIIGQGESSANLETKDIREIVRQIHEGDEKTRVKILKRIVGNGGLTAHLGTNDVREVERRIHEGDHKAESIYRAMAYGIAKEIGSMAAVLRGKIDAILITGGIANSSMLVDWIRERVAFLAPIRLYPGENEMEALALGALRVLTGVEEVKIY